MEPKTKIKILLVRPGGQFVSLSPPDAPMISPPKSLLYLAGVFKEDQSVHVKILDILAHPEPEQLEVKRKQSRRAPFYFGMSPRKYSEIIKNYQPDIIGITSSANYFFEEVIRFAESARKLCPSTFIVLGGPDATTNTTQYLTTTKAIDAIVLQEGERTFQQIVEAQQQGIKWKSINGIGFLEGNQITITEKQPFLTELDHYRCDYDLINMETYFDLNKKGFHSRLTLYYPESYRSIDLITSRGCHYPCSFCNVYAQMGKTMRGHSVRHVLDEMQFLVEKHGVKNFHFEDDNLLYDQERFKQILDGIIKAGWDITWDAPNGVRADLIDRELLRLCRDSGCTYLIFGVESGSQAYLNTTLKKKLKLDDVVAASKLCKEYQIDTMAFFIVGMPGETIDDYEDTYSFAINLLKKYNTTPIIQLWRPYENTELGKSGNYIKQLSQTDKDDILKTYKIPYTLFYNKIGNNSNISIQFISSQLGLYYRDVFKISFINWIKIFKRRPIKIINMFFQFIIIFIKMLCKFFCNLRFATSG